MECGATALRARVCNQLALPEVSRPGAAWPSDAACALLTHSSINGSGELRLEKD
jgi:hypothetical protein